MLQHLQSLSEGIRAVQRTLEARLESLDRKLTSIDRLDSRVCSRIDLVEERLGKIAHAVGVKEGASVGDDEEDRKRLKVRLKEALDRKRVKAREGLAKPQGVLEYCFGICEPDGRTGKQGSRCARRSALRPGAAGGR
jgi:hypothetical protein